MGQHRHHGLVPQRGCSQRPKIGTGLAESGHLRNRVKAALSLGISLKRFEGWEPTEFHAHEYDDEGRKVRTIVTREPEWDDEQRNVVLALHQYEHELCSGCGGHLSKTLDKTVNRDVKSHASVCLDCAAIEAQRRMDHRTHKGDIESCQLCAKRSVWVENYIPRD